MKVSDWLLVLIGAPVFIVAEIVLTIISLLLVPLKLTEQVKIDEGFFK